MISQFNRWNDTIVALATPAGAGAIAVIRVSGEHAIAVVDAMFPSKNLLQQQSHTLHVGLLKNNNEILDEVVVALFIAPHSYTGENVVEISCHGSTFIQQKIITAVLSKNVRIARAGEFTQRAFINGKLDLTQAEAVADLIASNTEASKNAALKNMRGGFSIVLKAMREQLIQFSALIELELDFSQEDVAFVDRKKLENLITTIQQQTKNLLQSFQLGNAIRNGVNTVIVGKPNVGKSTLLNCLLNEDRALVSPIAGTTRDTVEEILNINGILFRLIDTAGMREHTQDSIEALGILRSREKMKHAALVIYLFDVNETKPEDIKIIQKQLLQNAIPYLLVGNKVDAQTNNFCEKTCDNIIFISAKNSINIDTLKNTLVKMVTQEEINMEATIVTNARHHEALQALDQSLSDIKKGLQEKIYADLLAIDIREALHYLGNISGDISNEDQLDFIFSKFCIGK